MSGAMTEFQHACPFDERNQALNPVSPTSQGDRPGDEVIAPGEGVVEQVKKESHEATDDVHCHVSR